VALNKVERNRLRNMNQDIRFCTTADGVRIAYAVSGKGPLLVMPATWLSHLEHQWYSLAWQPWLERLSQKYTLLRYDSRGCGLSDRDPPELSFEGWIKDIEAATDAAGFRQFDVLATCWGGPIGVEYAARHPDRVTRLVLYGTYGVGRLRREIPVEAQTTRLLLDLTRVGWGNENHPFCKVWGSYFQPGGSLEHFRSWSEQQALSTSAETAVRLLEIGWQTDVRAAARKIRCPALSLHVARDTMVPVEVGRKLATLIPDCRFVQIDGENHMPLAEEPAWPQIVTEIESFLKQPVEAIAGRHTLALEDLTERERDVLEAIAQGLDNNEIAAALGMSEKTVRNHITRILDKIGVEHRYQAIVRARDAGFGLNRPPAAS
jgi:pimeloyl-ACP methyl ester carboxylesterase/DNA-binding CsgD family transcriptional regulator